MERAPQNAQSVPPSTEVSREEKDHISVPHVEENTAAHTVDQRADEKKISRNQLINKLNHLNFEDRTVSVVFEHLKYPRSLSIRAFPLPCQGERLTCNWAEAVDIEQLTEFYHFECLHIVKGQELLEVRPEMKSLGEEQIVFSLPDLCVEISKRKLYRYQCNNISVYLLQNGALFYGGMKDYCAFQFRVSVETAPPQTFRWIDTDEPVTAVFTRDNQTLFSGECRIVKQDHGRTIRQLNLEPVKRQVRRFGAREFRSTRQMLSPSPDAVFNHPLFDKVFNLKVIDISGSGVAVEEEERLAVLLPGLIIPDLKLIFSDGSSLRCLAQVVYSKKYQEDRNRSILRCGLAILDMHVEDHIKLLALLHQASDANTYICNQVDMEALWDFFFETGFIYPKKYQYLQANKDTIKATYEKLYHHSPSIASHFIYQEKGRILAHIAMMRFYENTWLIHHHAAVRSAYNRGGLIVLNQVGRFINDTHRLYSMKMDYVFCFYRPDNKFPTHVFGGAARNIKNPEICSVDTFAYLHFKADHKADVRLPSNWRIAPVTDSDLKSLQNYYENEIGGLMLQALHLKPGSISCRQLAEAYREIGLKRDRHLFALHHREKLCAVIMVNLADIGLNMSDLTNSITLIVVNARYLTTEIVQKSIESISHYFDHLEIPVLIHPKRVADKVGLDYEKSYCLWAYDTRNLDPYFRFLKRLLKFIQH